MSHVALQSEERPSSPKPNELFYYFFHLNERDPHDFMDKWDQIPDTALTTKNYAQILYKTSVHLNAPNMTFGVRGQILRHIRTNIGAWLFPALDNIKHFNTQDLTNSLWSLAVLDSYYGQDSLTEAYKALRPYIRFHKSRHPADQKQVRDSDLWFTGKSTIPNPQWKKRPTHLAFEENIRAAFHKAGYFVERPQTPLIPELKQAIDFPVVTPCQKQGVWVEVDGPTHVQNIETAKQASDIEYNVHTQFRSALQRRLAEPDSIILRVDPITGKEIEKLLQEDTELSLEQMNFLCSSLFKAAHDAGPGIHRTIDPPQATCPMIPYDRNLKLGMTG